MVNLKLLPALASYMAMADDALQVNISIDKAEVPRGDSVTYTCTWNLDAEYGKSKVMWPKKYEGSKSNGQYTRSLSGGKLSEWPRW